MSNLKQLREHLRKREWVQLDREARRLVLTEHLPPAEAGQVYRAWGLAKVGMNDLYAAVPLLEKALPLALKARDWDTLGFTRSELGGVYITINDTRLGAEYLKAFLLDLDRYDVAQSHYGRVRFNLGLASKYSRQYPEALDHYQAAIEWFTLRGHGRHKAMAHQNMAWLLCTLGRPEEAKAHLEVADTYRETLPPDFEAEQLCGWAHYFWTVGKVGDAINTVQEVLMGKRAGVESYHWGQAAVTGARVAIYLDQRFFAEQLIQTALEASVDCGNPALANEVSQVRSDFHNRWGKEDGAAL